MLHAIAVAEPTLALLRKIQQIPLFGDFRLVGGTALALQLGHRVSVDLDFFGKFETKFEEIENELLEIGCTIDPYNKSKNIKQLAVDGIKVDFVNYRYEWIDIVIEEDEIKMAGLKDIAAMKLSAITGRGTKKDFVDVYFLLQHFTLQEMLNLYAKKYMNASLFPVMLSLSYFTDAEAMPMPEMLIPVEWDNIKTTIRKAIEDFDKENNNN